MRLSKLKKRRLEVLDAIQVISVEVNKRDSLKYSEAEETKVKELRAEFVQLEKDIQGEEEVQAILAQRSTEDPNMGAKRVDDAAKNRDDQWKTLKRSEEPEKTGYTYEPPKCFRSLGEQFLAVVRQGRGTASEQDLNKLRALNEWNIKERAAAGLSEAVDSDGGYLIQPDVLGTIMERVYQESNLAALCSKIGVTSSNRIKINGLTDDNYQNGSRWGGIQAFWANEAGTVTASKPKFRFIEMALQKLMALCYATDESLEDIAVMAGIIQNKFPLELAYVLDDAILFGNGAGKPQGFFNSKAKITVAAEGSQATNTILFNNIVKMLMAAWGPSAQKMRWFYNQDALFQLITMQFATGSSTPVPVFLPANSAAGRPYDMLFNRPIQPIMQCKTVGTEGDIILADMGEYLLIDKGGIKADSSMHVNFLSAEQVFRFQYRVNGQSTWDKAVTPQNGTNKQSPIITLATRP